jgi:adenosylcobinamide-GDP ribazoletransferase
MIKREITTFLNAVMFYSRIPVPRSTEFSNELLNRSTRYFTLVGLIIGGIGALVLWIGTLFLPYPIAIAFSMVATIWVTGAFHEDGLADFCDGFGGGYTHERILEIMKDSRIGTYGTVGLLSMLGTKFICLSNIQISNLPLVIIAAHAFSRFLPVCVIYTSQYVRADLTSKVKPIGHRDSKLAFIIALLFGSLFLCFLPYKFVILVIILSAALFIRFKMYIEKRLGGYTGDVLGALQQLAELLFYLSFIIAQNNFV